jgi:hypothetical protein
VEQLVLILQSTCRDGELLPLEVDKDKGSAFEVDLVVSANQAVDIVTLLELHIVAYMNQDMVA